MSTKQQIIDAIENLAEKKVDKEIHSKYNEMNRLNKQLQKDILNISQLLKVRKGIDSIFLIDHSTNIFNQDTIQKYWENQIIIKQKAWINDIKNYYRISLNSMDFEEYINHPSKPNEKVEDINKKIQVQAWDSIKGIFFEWFVIMIIIDCFYNQEDNVTIDLTGDNALPLNICGENYFLRTQKNIINRFNVDVKPDLVLTDNSSTNFDYLNVKGIIECKYLQGNIPVKDIRDIFTKGWQVLPHNICLVARDKVDVQNKQKIENFGITLIDNLQYNSNLGNAFKRQYTRIFDRENFKQQLIMYLYDKFEF